VKRLEAMPLVPAAAALAVGGGLLAIVAWSLWRARERLALPPLLLLVGVLGLMRAGTFPLPPDHVARLVLPPRVTLEGELIQEPTRFAPDRLRLLIETESIWIGPEQQRARGRVLVTLYGEPPALTVGQRVRGEFGLHRPVGFRNPGSFDYPAHLAREGIHLVGSGRADRVEALTPEEPPWTVKVKRWAMATLRQNLPPTSAALLAGLLLGERSELPEAIHDSFRRAGVYHILAVSGFNVALIASTVFLALTLLRVPRKPVACIASGVLVGYALVVGAQPSVLRATLMGLLLLFAILLDREANLFNSVALAALVILLWRPGDLWEPGFQLSFAATLGILWLTPPATAFLHSRGWPKWLAASAAVSAGAQLAVTPIMLSHFNQLSLIGVAANLVVVPLAGLATNLGLAALLLALVAEESAQFFFQTLWLILLALRAAVRFASAIPGAMVHLPAPHWSATLAFSCLLLLLPGIARSRRFLAIAGTLAVWVLALSLWPWIRPLDGRLRVTFLDVGQGDAAFIELPEGQRVLLDGGPGGERRFDVGQHVVAPFLWNRAVRRLDAVIMSHSDPDHAGGLGAVMRRFRVQEFWENGLWDRGSGDLYWLVERSGIVRRSLRQGEEIRLGAALLSVLNPPASYHQGSPRGGASDENSNSLVLRLDWGGLSLLFTGDLEQEGEHALIASGQPLRHLVLKVAHHGSRFSTTEEFLKAGQPALAVISVGARNPFRHPAPEVLERLERSGAKIYRTDRDGAVLMESDGTTLTITRWASRQTETWRLDSAGP
jgi:competence protein ComEC